MNLLYLDYFRTVAKLENMSRAAEILHVSQPALSKTISKLEETVGVSLFYRKRGKISLTPGGHLYFEYVERAFTELEKGDLLLAQLTRSSGGEVNIASSLGDVLAAIAQSFLTYEKSIRIRQLMSSPEMLWSRLLAGEVDFAITPTPFESPYISQEFLAREEIFIAVSSGHPLAGESWADLTDFKNDNFLVNEASFDSGLVKIACESVGFSPNILISSNESSVISEAMNSGMGVMFMPLFEVRRHLGGMLDFPVRNNIKLIRLKAGRVRRSIMMAMPKERQLSYTAKCLYEHCQEHFQALAEEAAQFLADSYEDVDCGATWRIPMFLGDPALPDSLVLRFEHP